MQSRVALAYAAARRWCWKSSQRGLCSATRSRTADPEVHSGELEAGPKVHQSPPKGTESNNTSSTKFVETDHASSKKDDPLAATPKSPTEPSSKLKSTGVNQPLEPSLQQKRQQSSKASVLEEASCTAGIDEAPFPEEKSRKEQEEDDRGYFKDHKASPLSELEIADTRNPLSRASDRTADSRREVGSGGVIVWLPEQLDTAEDSLRRATEIWRQNAMRGDPDAPHSRILRQLRGEDF
ncbi:uncharacterized protein LOC130936693 [Arachis stenosperma]|uniref:uncharacterized protein LOC130936693 n=1 Tax=Arachis stenosperma TaxID=217475 RepID=UPI0025AB755A|nr:uncharacterized protein LOC130936693 [Arachis stenosperma]